MKRHLLATGLCAALGACAELYPPAPPPPPSQPPPAAAFRANDFDWSTQRGTASIRGAVDYMRGGRRYSCAGQPVVLTPDAPYSRRRIVQLYGSSERASLPVSEVRARQANRPSDEYSAYVRHGSCDASGRFVFQGLPAGGWFMIAVAVPIGGGESMALMRRVETRPGSAGSIVID